MLELKEYIPDDDPRPVIAKCDYCGGEIHGAAPGYYGDDWYRFGDVNVCEYCLREYTSEYKVSG